VSVVEAERVVLCDGCGKPIEGRRRVRKEGNYHGPTCRSRWRRRRPAADEHDRLARLAVEAVRDGADPYFALSLVVWPPETADEARDLLGAA
jgi:hypothetical protein